MATRIVPVLAGGEWHALEDDEVVGRAHLRRRPDGRAYVAADAWKDDVAAALLAAVIDDVPGDLHGIADENDQAQLSLLAGAGFAEVRREDEFLIPVGPALAATAGPVPPGISIVSAAAAGSDRLARLDDRLRQDVPGTDGWVNEPAEFRRYTFGRHFDPELYLVAVAGGEYAGLVRMWRSAQAPRLGLIGVLRWHRRRGIARALLHQSFGVLAARRTEQVTAEADVTNTKSQALLARLGARRTGGTVELRRPG